MSDTPNEAPCPIPFEQRHQAVQRVTGPSTPAPMKLMAAKGMAPMAPRELATAQFVLTFDADPKVAETARNSLQALDERIANAVLPDKSAEPSVLGYLAEVLAENDKYAEKLLLNPTTPTLAFVEVARRGSEAVCELIANNQARILECPEIARALTTNAKALRSTVDRVVDFLVRNSVVLEDSREFEEAFFRLTGEERLKAASAIDIPLELIDESLLTAEQRALLGERRLIDEDDEGEDDEGGSLSLEQRIRAMTAGKKIALASKGNKQARSILLRDTNRLVALAAATSPLINESEIVTIAQSRSVHQDVIAHICRDKKNNWVRNYQVKVGLVSNPKTPLPEAMKLLPHLQKKDIKTVAKSRNVPIGVRNLAIKINKSSGG
ncbi:MAG: hypothetical protein IPK13_22085 [Deltaproteobacteria bacterium]|nr:hypothetical protein [Deltaproteobacteria bacterium]